MLIEEIEFYNVNGKKTTTVVPENTKIKKRVLNDRRTLYVGNLPKNCRKQNNIQFFSANIFCHFFNIFMFFFMNSHFFTNNCMFANIYSCKFPIGVGTR